MSTSEPEQYEQLQSWYAEGERRRAEVAAQFTNAHQATESLIAALRNVQRNTPRCRRVRTRSHLLSCRSHWDVVGVHGQACSKRHNLLGSRWPPEAHQQSILAKRLGRDDMPSPPPLWHSLPGGRSRWIIETTALSRLRNDGN